MLDSFVRSFHRRRLALALALAGAASAVAPTSSSAEPLSLDSCVTLALARNPDVRASEFELSAAEARLRQAGALDAPTLAWSVARLGSSLGNDERDESVRLSQDVPLFGQRAGTRAIARAERDRSRADLDLARLRVRGEVVRAYRRLQADSLTLRTLGELGAAAQDLEQMVEIRLRTGGARYLDVLRARAERARIDNEAVEAVRAVREDRRKLNTLMARGPDTPLETADSLAYAPLVEPLEKLVDRARGTRPGVAGARFQLARESAAVALARRARWPDVSASAGLDRVSGASGPGFGGEVELSLPFAPWSDRRSKVDESLALQAAAEARVQLAERSLEFALRAAYESARTAESQVKRFESLLLADARDAIRTAIQNYQSGQIEGLELFETLRTLHTIRLEHVRALLNYQLALADLEVAE